MAARSASSLKPVRHTTICERLQIVERSHLDEYFSDLRRIAYFPQQRNTGSMHIAA